MLNKDLIEIGAELSGRDETLDRLIELQGGGIRDSLTLSRELRESNTDRGGAVSFRVAIPSVRHKGASATGISAVTLKEDVDFGARDKRGIRLAFLISGKDDSDEYIEVKARLMHLLMDTEFTARLCAARSKDEFLSLIEQREQYRYAPPKPEKRWDCTRFITEPKRKRFWKR